MVDLKTLLRCLCWVSAHGAKFHGSMTNSFQETHLSNLIFFNILLNVSRVRYLDFHTCCSKSTFSSSSGLAPTLAFLCNLILHVINFELSLFSSCITCRNSLIFIHVVLYRNVFYYGINGFNNILLRHFKHEILSYLFNK